MTGNSRTAYGHPHPRPDPHREPLPDPHREPLPEQHRGPRHEPYPEPGPPARPGAGAHPGPGRGAEPVPPSATDGRRPRIRLFLVDDHPIFRSGVRLAVEGADDVEIVGEAGTEEEAIRALVHERVPADVVLMDMRLPGGGSGAAVTRALAVAAPPGGRSPHVLMMSVNEDDDVVVATLRAGARGYLVKGAPRAELLAAVRTVAGGGAVFSPSVAARLSTYFSAVHELPGRAAFPQLTEREREVLDLMARGHTNRQIARRLVLSEKTVRNHVSHVFAKLQITDRAAAVVRARDAGLGT